MRRSTNVENILKTTINSSDDSSREATMPPLDKRTFQYESKPIDELLKHVKEDFDQ